MPREKPSGVQLRNQAIQVTPLQWAYLSGEWSEGDPLPEGVEGAFERFVWGEGEYLSLEEAWDRVRGAILTAWIKRTPGTRPWPWWSFDAPRWEDPWKGASYHGTFPEPRTRLGGTGTPTHEALAVVPAFDRGIPAAWVSAWEVEYYNGRAVDVHGTPIGIEYSEGNLPYEAIDPNDPPAFESEAAYLDRLGLLTEEERAHFEAHGWPEPEAVTEAQG